MAQSRKLNLIVDLKDRASKQLDGMQSKLKSMQPTFQKMAVGGAVAFGGITTGAGKAIKSASKLEESINAVNVIFKEEADEILNFGENAAESVGLAQAEYNQLATQTGALLSRTGLAQEEVADKTVMLTKRAADLASVYDTSVGDALSAINQALRGETEAIRRYSGDVTDATLENYALANGIEKSVSEMSQQEKRLLRMQVLMSQTNVVQGDFRDTSDSLANTQRILTSQIENISAKIGKTLMPVLKDILNAVKPIVMDVAAWVDENPQLTKTIIIASGAIAGIVAILGTLGILIASVTPAISLFGTVIGALSIPMLAIIATIGLLVAAGWYWYRNWDEIKKGMVYAWQDMKKLFFQVVDSIKKKFKAGIDFLIQGQKEFEMLTGILWDKIKDTFKSSVDWIMDNTIGRLIDGFDRIIDMAQRARRAMARVGGGIRSRASSIIGGIRDRIPGLAEGGIVTRPTLAMVGEGRESEAIIPLSKLQGVGGNNINVTVNVKGDMSGRDLKRKLKEDIFRDINREIKL